MTARDASHTAWRTLTTAVGWPSKGAIGASMLTLRTIGRSPLKLTPPLLRSTHGPPRPCAEYRRVQAVQGVREARRADRRVRARARARIGRRAARALRVAARARDQWRAARRPATRDLRHRPRDRQAHDEHAPFRRAAHRRDGPARRQ